MCFPNFKKDLRRKKRIEERLSPSEPSFYAASDSIHNSYQWKSPLRFRTGKQSLLSEPSFYDESDSIYITHEGKSPLA